MEDRSRVRSIQGVANARRVASASVADSDLQEVTVTEGHGEVRLALSTSSYPAGLSPEQARALAAQLTYIAERVERASQAEPTP